MRLPREIAADRKAKEARREELGARLSERERAADGLRERIGRAVAAGEPTDNLRSELREADDDADGLRRALDVLAAEIRALTSEATAAAGAEADERAERLAREAEAATATAQEEALGFLRRYADAETAAQRAYLAAEEAEREADRSNRRRSPAGHPRFSRAIAARYPAMSAVPLGRVREALRRALAEAGLDRPGG